jgi:hypothetical protein
VFTENCKCDRGHGSGFSGVKNGVQSEEADNTITARLACEFTDSLWYLMNQDFIALLNIHFLIIDVMIKGIFQHD